MTKERLLEIANELNRLVTFSDKQMSVNLEKFHNGEMMVIFWHHSPRYEGNCDCIEFYELDASNKIDNKLELAKKVIKGECLIDE
ncbi:hypothetical protein LZU07_01950 [Staphylococcus epidermidis]|uniref:hypothetical protein n=1 Tax=Staphylococcus epidermidis TaxID=1282 RepID=UPI0020966AF8|nr:hypothetical protein [Staphylococcus epidermidis]MCG1063016.1 hypothetical protein [Staphylococcus epidermidis]MCG2181431.1 hypothetical protein [Staphylococcus epidermidis]MCO6310327.1 hypothetical protein [Staphylococcus epidermidis]